MAVISQHLLIVRYLIELGVAQDHKDKTGKTARDYAVEGLSQAKSKQEQVNAKNIANLLS